MQAAISLLWQYAIFGDFTEIDGYINKRVRKNMNLVRL